MKRQLLTLYFATQHKDIPTSVKFLTLFIIGLCHQSGRFDS